MPSPYVFFRAYDSILKHFILGTPARRDIWGTTPWVLLQPGLSTAQTHISEGGVRDIKLYGYRKPTPYKTVSPDIF